MNKIHFESIDIEGFRSIVKPLHFNLNKPGLNLIKGINGAGKTSIFEALIWALYGTNLKDVNQAQVISWPEVRTSQWQGTKVAVEFQVADLTYTVTRCISYKGLVHEVKGEDYLFLAKDGIVENKDRNKDLTQQAINQLLGVDARTFMNSILFGQRMQKLITQENKDKRELFETLFETEWVNAAKAKCDTDISTWGSKILVLGMDINVANSAIEHLNDKLVTAKETIAGFEEQRTNRILNKQNELEEYNTKLVEFKKELKEYQDAQDLLKYDAEAHTKLEKEFEDLEKQFNEADRAQIIYNSNLTTAQNLVASKKAEALRINTEHLNLVNKHIEGSCPYCEQELRAGNKLEINHNKDIALAWEKVTCHSGLYP